MRHHAFQARCHHLYYTSLVLVVTIRGRQVRVEIFCDQEFCAPGALSDGHHNELQCGGVMWVR